MDRNQINLRLPPELAALVDAKRIELMESMGKIPTRSDVLRLALSQYLNVEMPQSRQGKRTEK